MYDKIHYNKKKIIIKKTDNQKFKYSIIRNVAILNTKNKKNKKIN